MSYLYTFLDVIAGILVLFTTFYCIKNYRKLPAIVPTHFDPDNQPDAFGNKKWIFMYPILGLLFFVGFLFVLRDPEGFNYAVEITPENQERQFTIALIALRILLIIVLLVFLNLVDFSVRKALDKNAKPFATFATVLITIILTTVSLAALSSIIN